MALGKWFCFCFHRKQKAMDSFQVKMDKLRSRKTFLNLTDRRYLSTKATTGPPKTWSLSQNFIRGPKDTLFTDSREQFGENNVHIPKSWGGMDGLWLFGGLWMFDIFRANWNIE